MNARGFVPTSHRGWLVRALFAVLLAQLAGCAQLVPQTIGLRTDWPAGVPERTEISELPFFPQTDYQCGPAALATVLAHSGVAITPEPLVSQVWLPSRRGSLQIEMLAAPRRYGRVSYVLAPRFADLLREVAAGHPVLVLQDVGLIAPQWHYAVVNGFDYASGSIYLRSDTRPRVVMPFTAFERSWMKGGYWAMVAQPPNRIPVSASESGWTEAVLALDRAHADGGVDMQAAWTATLQRWPSNLPAAVGLANQHYARGELTAAAEVLREAHLRHPESAAVINNLAQTLSDLGHHAAALQVLQHAGGEAARPFSVELAATRAQIELRSRQEINPGAKAVTGREALQVQPVQPRRGARKAPSARRIFSP